MAVSQTERDRINRLRIALLENGSAGASPALASCFYPPAMAPTIRKGSSPDAIAAGSGVSGVSCEKS
jgi:hypothetical protein